MPGLTNEKPTKRAEHTSRFQPTSGPAPGIYGECRLTSVIGAEPVPVGFSRHPDVRPGFQSGAAPRSPSQLLACSPPRLLACSPPRLLACSPARLLACSPPRLHFVHD